MDGYVNSYNRASNHQSAYYPEQRHQYEGQHQYNQLGGYPAGIHYDANNGAQQQTAAGPNCSMFQSLHHRVPFVAHPYAQPDNYGTTQGDPVSAIAVVDENHGGGGSSNHGDEAGTPTLMYVASHTSRQGERRRGSNNNVSAPQQDPSLSRGSRITVLYDGSAGKGAGGYYGDRSIYSTFVAHPQAPLERLDALHSVLFGNGRDTHHYSLNTLHHAPKARPSHAYGPPFGPPSLVAHYRNRHRTNYSLDRPEERHCMGITRIMPVTTPYLGSGGRVCSVSPSGMRIHTRGGMLMSHDEDLLSGMVCGVLTGGGSQFATVGGMSFPSTENPSSDTRRTQHVRCVDLSRDLKMVSSHSLVRDGEERQMMCATDMAWNHHRNNIVVGCSDGTFRVLDGRGRRNTEVAKAKAQPWGVAKVAVFENLICTTGYTSPGHSSPNSPFPYPFPSPHVLIYDLRCLGRGGIPHTFSTTFHHRGGPRFVNFLPDGRLLVGSGLTFGGFEVITPFCDATAINENAFFQPELNSGEAMTTVDVYAGDALYIGTSYGRVLQYRLTDSMNTIHLANKRRGIPKRCLSGKLFTGAQMNDGDSAYPSTIAVEEPLDMPSFMPVIPAASIDPAILLSSSNNNPPGSETGMRGWNVSGGYVLSSPPLLSSDGRALLHQRYSRLAVRGTMPGPLGSGVLVPSNKRWLSNTLQTKLNEKKMASSIVDSSGVGDYSSADFVKVFPTMSLELDDSLMTPENSPRCDISKNQNKATLTKTTNPNPNKFLYSTASFAACYDATADSRKKMQDSSRPVEQQYSGEQELIPNKEDGIPIRYRLMVRPPFYKVSNFEYTAYNDTGLWVGWDYAPSFANSFVCSVLALLYFVREIRELALQLQLSELWGMPLNKMQVQQQQDGSMGVHAETSLSITAQLGLLFHLIETLSANGMIQPSLGTTTTTDNQGQVKAFVPSNFISSFALLPEATNLALVDGVAGSGEIARRPEAFYRFLMQYIERELGQLQSSSISTEQAPKSTSNHSGQLIDCMQGVGFLSIIEYATGKPKISTSRAFTVDLAYDKKLSRTNTITSANTVVRFGEILRFSLCKELSLRAWCEDSHSYESVTQRRIATNLPTLLSLSCCCAGSKADNHGLQFWQQEDSRNWLPEFINIQIEMDRSITVEELIVDEEGKEKWMRFEHKLPEPTPFLETCNEELPQKLPIKKSYQLDAVLSFIRTNPGASAGHDASHSCEGHHVVHVRTPKDFESEALRKQLHQIERCLAEKKHNSATNESFTSATTFINKQLTLASDISFEERQYQVQEKLRKLREKEDSQWILLNGFVVTKIDKSDDIRSFNAKFREPSIVLFREITDQDYSEKAVANVEPTTEQLPVLPRALQEKNVVPVSAMKTTSISDGRGPKHGIYANSGLKELPTNGALLAIDTEFVCVQQEEAMITSSGSKEITSEPRNALARLSVVNCQTKEVIVDDYILPLEPVVDYLTRFSGIRKSDLDTNNSPHHLVTPNEAYLKVRLLMERGCIFVGHGLSQDFRIINICIPPNQIIDTAEIFHQPNQRYISLRYLTNYVIGRDMQQEVHDSIEDARAAHELYLKALSLKKEGRFDDYLMQLYEHGHRTQFKLGVVNN